MKFSVNLPDETVGALRELAEKRNTTVTQVLRDAVASEVFLQRELETGAKLLIEMPDRRTRELVFKHGL
jgi:predicted transcriptional regulator